MNPNNGFTAETAEARGVTQRRLLSWSLMVRTSLLCAVSALSAASAVKSPSATAGEVTVKDDAGLRAALGGLKPGTTVLLASGEYRGGLYLKEVSGTAEQRITIRGADREKPPVITGGRQALHLVDCNYVTLADLEVRGFPENGVNVDDGGSFETPSRGVIIERLRILDTGPTGNHDGLKMSGVDDFVVRECRFEGWGGSAIDMVGCHRGTVERCRFEGKAGFSQDNAVQMKGGTSGILVHLSFFKDAGQRAINLGGSTGLQFFRPEVGNFEAREIVVAGNRFTGSLAPVAFVTARGGRVHHNTFHLPAKWALRILQESQDERFKPCAGGVFENNLVVFDKQVQTFVNVGPRTDAASFTFRNNAWFEAGGGARKPDLPAAETGGIYGVDPKLEKPGTPEMRATNPELKDAGADAYRPEEAVKPAPPEVKAPPEAK